MLGDRSASPAARALRAEILDKTRDYFHAAYLERQFVPDQDPVPVSGRVFDERELVELVDSSLDFWLTAGRFAERAAEPGVTGEAFNFSPELGYTVLEIVEAVGVALGVAANPTILDTATMEIRDQTLDATKARERLNWRPSWSLERGLDETVTWYRKHLPWAPPSVLI